MRLLCLSFMTLGLLGPYSWGQVRQLPGQGASAYRKQIKYFEQGPSLTKVVLKSNGLTVLVHEFHAVPLVDVRTYFAAGYGSEPRELAGVTEVLARMIFRGTTSRKPEAVGQDILALGGSLGVDTGYDGLSFHSTVPAPQWKRALEIQSDILFNPLFSKDELRHAVSSALQASRSRLESPAWGDMQRLMELSFGDDPVWRGRFPTDESLGRINRDNLKAWYESMLDPGKTLLVVAGDVITSDILNEVVRLYGRPLRSPGERAGVKSTPQEGFRYEQQRDEVGHPRVLMGFHTPPLSSPDYPAVQMMRAVLAVGEGSVLSRRLKNDKKVVIGLKSNLIALSDRGYLSFELDSDADNIDRCEIGALTEFEILKRREPDEADMARAAAQLEREFWEERQTVADRSLDLADYESAGGWKSWKDYPARLRKVRPADVSRVAEKYLGLERCSLVEVLPRTSEPRNVTRETARQTISDLLGLSTGEELAKREKETTLSFDLPAASAAFSANQIRHAIQKASILRGPELAIREDHTLPLIEMGFYFPGGKLFETDANSGLTELTLRSILRDTTEEEADRIYRQLEIYGGRIERVVKDDYFGVDFSILSGNVDKGLDLLIGMLKSPKLDDDEIKRQKQIQIAALDGGTGGAAGRLVRRVQEALFAGHPYARAAGGSKASVEKLGPEDVRAWYKSHVENQKPVVVIVGDTQGTSLAGFFVRNFSGSRYEDVKLPGIYLNPLEKKVEIDLEWPGGYNAAAIGFQAPPAGDEDSYPLAVLVNYAAGPGGPFVEDIAHGNGPASSLSSTYWSGVRGGCLVFAAAGSSSPEELQKSLETEVGNLLDKPVSYRDYRSAQSAAAGGFLIGQQVRFRQISAVTESILAGTDLEGIENFSRRLEEVRQEDLPEVARRFFKLDNSVILRLKSKPAQ